MSKNNRWTIFSSAPHRMMMFGGAVQLVVVLVFWSAELVGRYTGFGTPLDTTLATTRLHGFLMIYMLFLFFIYGFLMTTYPRWMNGPLVPRKGYTWVFLLLITGAVVFYIGAFVSRSLTAAGVLVFLVGHTLGIILLYRVYRDAAGGNKLYEKLLNGALMGAWVGMAVFVVALLADQWWLLPHVPPIGIWWFLMPVLVAVSHRMIPFFTSSVPEMKRVHHPHRGLPIMFGGVVIHGLLEIVGLTAWTWVVDFPAGIAAVYHVLSWGLLRSFQVWLLAMLHVAFAWFGLGMLLFGIRSLTFLVSGYDHLGLAPLHALGIGFALSMTVAMASRVTLGHSGRALEAGLFTWLLFWGVSVAAVLRIGAELGFGPVLGRPLLNLVAALFLLIVMLSWTLRYGPMYLKARVDGKPG